MDLLRRPELPLFVLVFGVYAYFYQAGGWNQNSRFDLTRAIVEHGTVRIDAFHENTGDKAERGGHFYSDKAPGLSWLAVPPYAVVHALRPGAIELGAYLATVFALGLPSAVAVVALFRFARRLGASAAWAAGVALAYGLGTLAFPYSTVLYGHQLQAALLFIAFTLIGGTPHTVAAGALLGFAVAVDYTSGLGAAVIAVYAVWGRGPRAVAEMGLGAALPLGLLAVYHTSAFGGPLALPYHFVLQEHRRLGWFMGIGRPDAAVVGELLFGAYRGLFYSAPWLLAGVPGLVLLRRRAPMVAAAAGAVFVLHLLLNAGLVDWHGGWAMGPRYLIPALPFLALGTVGLPIALTTTRARWAMAAIGGTLAAVSIAFMLAGTAVRPEVPMSERRPYRDYVFPLLMRGRVARSNHAIDSAGSIGRRAAWNLGHHLGLEGRLTLAPLALWAMAAGFWLRASLRGERDALR